MSTLRAMIDPVSCCHKWHTTTSYPLFVWHPISKFSKKAVLNEANCYGMLFVRHLQGSETDLYMYEASHILFIYTLGHDEPHSSGVPPIRLVNGSTPLEGRVEIKWRGRWGTMCGKGADVFTAKVICRQVGYFGNAEVLEHAYFGQGEGPVWIQPSCRGDELSVDECPSYGWNKTRCKDGSHEFDLAVVCGGE